MSIVVYVDDVLFFGPDGDEMRKVVSDLKLDGLELKIEKETNVASFDFLGIHIEQQKNKNQIDKIKMPQLCLINKFLETICML